MGTSNNNAANAFKYIVGWIIIILLLLVINRTKLGHAIVYYVIWLSALLLIVTNYKAISSLIGAQA